MPEPRVLTFREALREAMVEKMDRYPSIFLMGEEVGHYNGAYKVSEGMLARFGERRVIDTPIAETGFAGVGIGAAMVGLRPIIEFMTWNFSLTSIDQLINNAAKLRYMSNGQFTLPIVFRGPGGAAHALAAQHSQALEGFYAHVPGLKVVMPSTPADAKGLLKAAIRDDNPVVFIESEVMYALKGDVPAGEHVVPLGVADVKRPGRDVTLVAWSKMVHTALKAADVLTGEGIEAEVVDLRTLRPLDERAVLASVARTHRCVVVQEGWPFAGLAAELIALVAREGFDDLDAPPERVTNLDVPMPYARNLENVVLPSPERVVATVRRVLGLTEAPRRPAVAGRERSAGAGREAGPRGATSRGGAGSQAADHRAAARAGAAPGGARRRTRAGVAAGAQGRPRARPRSRGAPGNGAGRPHRREGRQRRACRAREGRGGRARPQAGSFRNPAGGAGPDRALPDPAHHGQAYGRGQARGSALLRLGRDRDGRGGAPEGGSGGAG